MLIFETTDTLSGAIFLEIWACTCSAYHIWTLSRKSVLDDRFTFIGWLSSRVVENSSSCYEELVMFFNQALYLVCPLSFKHVSNQKSRFAVFSIWKSLSLTKSSHQDRDPCFLHLPTFSYSYTILFRKNIKLLWSLFSAAK